jgi:hypothetical protein
MQTIIINIHNEALADKVTWLLEHFQEEGLEIVSKEDLDDLELLRRIRGDEAIPFDDFLRSGNFQIKIGILERALQGLKKIEAQDQEERDHVLETLNLLRDKRSLQALLDGHKSRGAGEKPAGVSVEEAFPDLWKSRSSGTSTPKT